MPEVKRLAEKRSFDVEEKILNILAVALLLKYTCQTEKAYLF